MLRIGYNEEINQALFCPPFSPVCQRHTYLVEGLELDLRGRECFVCERSLHSVQVMRPYSNQATLPKGIKNNLT